jgi:NitT/TauT family transport system substrate-binding protein
LAAALVAGSVLSGCQGRDATPDRATRPIRVAIQPFLGFGPLLIAQAEGFFADVGLTVEFVKVNRSFEALPGLIRGDLDVLAGPAHSAVISAMTRGEAIRFVADKGYLARDSCTSTGITVRADFSPERAKTALRRISLSRDGPSRYIAGRQLASQGIELDSIETVLLPDAAEAEALRKGLIDATSGGEPWFSRTKREFPIKLWLEAQDFLPDHQYSFIIYGPYLLQTNRDAGVRFLAAFRRGVMQFSQGKTERNLDILTRETGESRATLEEACWPVIRSSGRIGLASLLEYQRWARDHEYIDAEATPEQLWDSSFVVASDPLVQAGKGRH